VGEKRGFCNHELRSLPSGLSGLISRSSCMFMMSPTENEEPMPRDEEEEEEEEEVEEDNTEVSKLERQPIRTPWDVPATDGRSWWTDSMRSLVLLGFLSAISASTLNGRMATLGLAVAVAVSVSTGAPRLGKSLRWTRRRERDGTSSSSLFKPSVRVDMMAADGAMQFPTGVLWWWW